MDYAHGFLLVVLSEVEGPTFDFFVLSLFRILVLFRIVWIKENSSAPRKTLDAF